MQFVIERTADKNFRIEIVNTLRGFAVTAHGSENFIFHIYLENSLLRMLSLNNK